MKSVASSPNADLQCDIFNIHSRITEEKSPMHSFFGNSTPSLGEFAGFKSALLRGLRPFPDLPSSDSAVLCGLPIVFPLSLKGPHHGSPKIQSLAGGASQRLPQIQSPSLGRSRSLIYIFLSNHFSPNHPSVISCSFAIPVGLSPVDL
ncbi:hypothetical protein TNCV_132541 [Trichonephila clavipes]|nr:hypothetical protein TNCV_132541 [Trichonephila clavipes]